MVAIAPVIAPDPDLAIADVNADGQQDISSANSRSLKRADAGARHRTEAAFQLSAPDLEPEREQSLFRRHWRRSPLPAWNLLSPLDPIFLNSQLGRSPMGGNATRPETVLRIFFAIN